MGWIRRAALAVARTLGPRTSEVQAVVNSALPRSTPVRRESAQMLATLHRNPLLRQSVYRLASDAAGVKIKVMRAGEQAAAQARQMPPVQRLAAVQRMQESGDVAVFEGHPLTEMMKRGVPGWMTGHQMMKMTYIHREVAGEAFWALGRSAIGVPSEALLIQPTAVASTPTRDAPEYKLTGRFAGISIPEWEMLAFRELDPEDPYSRSRSPTAAIAGEVDAHEVGQEIIRRTYQSGGPQLLLVGSDIARHKKTLRAQWRRATRAQSGFEPLMMDAPENGDLQVHEVQQDLRSLQVEQIRISQARAVHEYYGIPPSLRGNFTDNSGLGRSGVELEEHVYLRFCTIPRVEDMVDTLQNFVDREFGPGLLVHYESPLREDWTRVLEVMKAQPAAFQVDEWRVHGAHSSLRDVETPSSHLVPAGVEPRETLDPVVPLQPADDPLDDELLSGIDLV